MVGRAHTSRDRILERQALAECEGAINAAMRSLCRRLEKLEMRGVVVMVVEVKDEASPMDLRLVYDIETSSPIKEPT
jgi:hypothetical protein